MEFSRYKVVLVLLVAVILTVTVLSRNHLQQQRTISRSRLQQAAIVDVGTVVQHAPAALSGTTGYRAEDPERDVVPYKQGKEIIYQPRTDCIKPELLKDYRNPCWISTRDRNEVMCTARVMLLGFHKCGSSDLSSWFKSHDEVLSSAKGFFADAGLTSKCPLNWLQDLHQTQRWPKDRTDRGNKTAFHDCPGCVLISKVLKENTTHIIRQSTIQYLQYIMVEESRYIITMREPADRMISQFFYTYQRKDITNPYRNYSLNEVGNAFFHKIITEAVTYLRKCLRDDGTTSCIIRPLFDPIERKNKPIIRQMTVSCYVTHLKEVFKFIPKEKIYFSKLDEYSEDEVEAMKRIYRFVGVSTAPLNNAGRTAKNMGVVNAGYKAKPVLPETIETLQKFYLPFNIELATLLDDDKWLWK